MELSSYKLSTLKFLCVFLLFVSVKSIASNTEYYAECNLCSAQERSDVASNWTMDNMMQGNTTDRNVLTVIDLANRQAITYSVGMQIVITPSRIPTKMPVMSEIATSPYVQKELQTVNSAVVQLANESSELEIPKTVLPDAWQFVNCASCENDISDFLNKQLMFQVEYATQTLTTFAQIFGVQATGIPDVFRVSLESGGYVEFATKLINDPLTLQISISKIVDVDNNTIPAQAKNLHNLILRINNELNAQNINHYINNFRFYLPMNKGYVTIKPCLTGDQDPCKGGN